MALKDHQKLVGKYLSIPGTKCSGESFCNFFHVATKMVHVLEDKTLEKEVRTDIPCVNQKILRPTCLIQLHPWLQPCDCYLWQQAGCSGLLQSYWTIVREGLVLDLEAAGSWGQSDTQYPNFAFVANHFRRLVTVWTLFGPMSQLHICLLPCPLRTWGLPWASLEGGQHLGMPVSFLFSLSWALAPLSCSLL